MTPPDRDEIRVSCAIIEKNGFVLAAQRGHDIAMPLKWEFPGGKIESHETPEECIKREILEELGIQIRILGALKPLAYPYPDFDILLYPFICEINEGRVVPREHAAILWLDPENLKTMDWSPADLPVIDAYHGWRSVSAAETDQAPLH